MGIRRPFSLKQKSCHTGLVSLPGQSPPTPLLQSRREVQAASALCCRPVSGSFGTCAKSLLWTLTHQAFAVAGRSRQTGWVIEHMQLVYFAHKPVTTLGGGAALLKGKEESRCFSSLRAPLCQLQQLLSRNKNKLCTCVWSTMGRRCQEIKRPRV